MEGHWVGAIPSLCLSPSESQALPSPPPQVRDLASTPFHLDSDWFSLGSSSCPLTTHTPLGVTVPTVHLDWSRTMMTGGYTSLLSWVSPAALNPWALYIFPKSLKKSKHSHYTGEAADQGGGVVCKRPPRVTRTGPRPEGSQSPGPSLQAVTQLSWALLPQAGLQ